MLRDVLQQWLQTNCLERVERAPEATTIDMVCLLAIAVPQPRCQLLLVPNVQKLSLLLLTGLRVSACLQETRAYNNHSAA